MGVGGASIHAFPFSLAPEAVNDSGVQKNIIIMNAFIKLLKNTMLCALSGRQVQRMPSRKIKAQQMEFDFSQRGRGENRFKK